tara:strand:+ start:1146 stop:1436 length:291 start_codon:yes stop_codon:yes gene_type:complete
MKSIRRGDYGSPWTISNGYPLVRDMLSNMRRVRTSAERSHAIEQVRYAEATKSITSQHAVEITEVIDKAWDAAALLRAADARMTSAHQPANNQDRS